MLFWRARLRGHGVEEQTRDDGRKGVFGLEEGWDIYNSNVY